MPDTAPVADQVGHVRKPRLAFVAAVVSLVAVFAAVGSTIPLFNIYRAEDGFANADLATTVVACSAATLATLLGVRTTPAVAWAPSPPAIGAAPSPPAPRPLGPPCAVVRPAARARFDGPPADADTMPACR